MEPNLAFSAFSETARSVGSAPGGKGTFLPCNLNVNPSCKISGVKLWSTLNSAPTPTQSTLDPAPGTAAGIPLDGNPFSRMWRYILYIHPRVPQTHTHTHTSCSNFSRRHAEP
ncbi:hypothetical protein Vafri_7344 [Volvox africanus]|uniref:Uncharacterized protein n=1 Tax=Volvox africanus TaxID=51714 RepID=A0A8J4B0M3_9CHLO|nr:hypothetical protein Vafri_7344 [Volvox africanus]